MFRVNDIVICKERNRYSVTNEHSLCLVTHSLSNSLFMKVKVIATTNNYRIPHEHQVEIQNFKLMSIKEYLEMFPEVSNYDDFIFDHVDHEATNISNLYFHEPETEPFILSDEERERLIDEMTNLLTEYDYNPTEFALNKILDEWAFNKSHLIKTFEKHPNYNGKYQIVFDSDFARDINTTKIAAFQKYAIEAYAKQNEETIDGLCYLDVYSHYCKIRTIYRNMRDILYTINGFSEENLDDCESKLVFEGKTFSYYLNEFNDLSESRDSFVSNYYIYDENYAFTRSGYENLIYLNAIITKIIDDPIQFATFDFVEFVNERFSQIKAVEGQKVSRILNKLCKILSIDKDERYNKEFAKFSDAVNPLAIKRHTIISCHPIDYFTMSFGNSWASCHTIDRKNIRNMDGTYHGEYSAGTLSYMLDSTSAVFYTVHHDYDGDKLELEPKINRNMFHIGNGKIIQGRVYPQSNDLNNTVYEEIRNIVQKVIADCWGVPNMWHRLKGRTECEEITLSEGVHYRDYTNYDSCSVSFLNFEK